MLTPGPRDVGICLLAGGEATRLPGKIGLPVDGEPMLLRLIAAFGEATEIVVSVHASLPSVLAARVRVPVVADVGDGRGPLLGIRSTLPRMTRAWVAVIAGDAPFAGPALIRELTAARRPGDEAVVPVRRVGEAELLEPLLALYDRAALLAAGEAAHRAGERAVHDVLRRLHVRRIAPTDDRLFVNVNTPAEYAAIRGTSRR